MSQEQHCNTSYMPCRYTCSYYYCLVTHSEDNNAFNRVLLPTLYRPSTHMCALGPLIAPSPTTWLSSLFTACWSVMTMSWPGFDSTCKATCFFLREVKTCCIHKKREVKTCYMQLIAWEKVGDFPGNLPKLQVTLTVSVPFPENEPQWHLKSSVLHVYLSNMHKHACLTIANSSRGWSRDSRSLGWCSRLCSPSLSLALRSATSFSLYLSFTFRFNNFSVVSKSVM